MNKNNLSRRIYIGITVVAILLIPYFLNMPWTVFDYVVAAVLIGTTGFALEIATRKITGQKKKLFVGFVILTIFVYVWAELAVGIFTNLGS